MEHFLQDLKYCVRTLRQQRAFTVAAVATLALGIGATTAVFSVVNAVLLRPFPFPDADRIVLFMNTSPNGDGPGASPAKFAHWRRQTDAVRDASAYRTVLVNYTGGDTPEQVTTAQVSPPFFHLLGATPVLGRTFTADEDLPTAGKGRGPLLWMVDAALRSRSSDRRQDDLAQRRTLRRHRRHRERLRPVRPRRSAGRVDDVSRSIRTRKTRRTTSECSAGSRPASRSRRRRRRLAQSATAYRERFPGSIGPKAGFSVEPMQKIFVRNSQSLLVVLLAAVAGVLLIACANVANLLLVRSTVRKRELAIRAAMGADRGRIIRQLLTESVLLSLAGGAAGPDARPRRHSVAHVDQHGESAAFRRQRRRDSVGLAAGGVHHGRLDRDRIAVRRRARRCRPRGRI